VTQQFSRHDSLPPSLRPTLFYKSTCPPCRWMSRLSVVLSLGIFRRIAINSAEAKELYSRYPDQRGKLVLIHPYGVTFGRKVFAVTPFAILMVAWAFVAYKIRPILRS